MKLETKRLILREYGVKDIKEIIENINNLKVSRYLLVVPHPYTMEDAKWWIGHCKEQQKENPRKSYQFAIGLKSEGKLIGGCGIGSVDEYQGTGELGYWLGEKYWRQGYMTEVGNKLIEFAFQKLKLRKLKIPAFTANQASNGLAKKLGFKLEGTLTQHCRAKSTGKIHDENIYGLLKKEWKK